MDGLFHVRWAARKEEARGQGYACCIVCTMFTMF